MHGAVEVVGDLVHEPDAQRRLRIAALASDPEVLEKTGRALPVADLAAEYGFTDPEDA